MRIIFLIICLALAGCATAPAVHAVCLPQRAYTPEERQAIALAIAGLPANSALIGVVGDYTAMLDANAACRK